MVWVFVALLIAVMVLVAYIVIACGRMRNMIHSSYVTEETKDIRNELSKSLYRLACHAIFIMVLIALVTSASIALL